MPGKGKQTETGDDKRHALGLKLEHRFTMPAAPDVVVWF